MDKPKLLPLKFCSIERAARMLRVEVEDIEHWLKVGVVSGAVLVPEPQPATIKVSLRDESIDKLDHPFELSCVLSNEHCYFATEEWSSDDGTTFYKAYYGEIPSGEPEFDPDLHWDLTVKGHVSGYLELVHGSLVEVLLGQVQSAKFHLPVRSDLSSSCFGINSEIQRSDIVLLNSALNALYELIYGGNESITCESIDDWTMFHNLITEIHGDRFLDKPVEPTESSKDTLKHGNSVLNEKRRQEVIGFAWYLKHEFPDKCKTGSAWADLVEEKAPLKWPDTAEPPLSRDSILKLLRSLNKLEKYSR